MDTIAADRNTDADKGWASEFAGKWTDNRTAEEIISNTHQSRATNRNIEHYRHESLCGIFNSGASEEELIENYLTEKYL